MCVCERVQCGMHCHRWNRKSSSLHDSILSLLIELQRFTFDRNHESKTIATQVKNREKEFTDMAQQQQQHNRKKGDTAACRESYVVRRTNTKLKT